MYEIMQAIRNFFTMPEQRIEGTFTIKDGKIDLPFEEGQYFILDGSLKNSYKCIRYGDYLEDETFTGVVFPQNIPNSFIALCETIKDYNTKNNAIKSPYISESFGGYSYHKATKENGMPVGWQDVFKDQLKVWRKL